MRSAGALFILMDSCVPLLMATQGLQRCPARVGVILYNQQTKKITE